MPPRTSESGIRTSLGLLPWRLLPFRGLSALPAFSTVFRLTTEAGVRGNQDENVRDNVFENVPERQWAD